MPEHIHLHCRNITCKLITKAHCNVIFYMLITRFKIRINRGTGKGTRGRLLAIYSTLFTDDVLRDYSSSHK